MANKGKVKIVTPKGVAKWPWLTKPNEKFTPQYSINLILDITEAQATMDKLDEMLDEQYTNTVTELKKAKKHDEAKKVTRNEPYSLVLDDEGNETGRVEFKFKRMVNVKDRNGEMITLPPPQLVDSKGKSIPNDVAVYGGSICRVSFQANPYYVSGTKACGVSLRLLGVQVVELRTDDASDFPIEEDGFEYAPTAPAASAPAKETKTTNSFDLDDEEDY